jgi:peptide/nickel transport system permease protein
MATTPVDTLAESPADFQDLARKPRSQWQIVRRELGKNKAAMIGLAVLIVFVVLGILAPLIAPYDPIEINPKAQFCEPSFRRELLGWAADGSEVYAFPHIMGCDEYGRDLFSRVLTGTTVSLQVAIVCNFIGFFFGTIFGLLSGYFGGTVDFATQRVIDILYAFPGILLAMAVIAIIGPGLYNVMFAIGISWIPVYTRLVRGSVLSAKQELYVEAAECIGAGTGRIVGRHILPNIASSLIVLGSMNIGTAILTAAALSFIGLGVQRPDPEWGVILNGGRRYMTQAPWMTIYPGLAIAITVLAVNMFGDGLRSALDPRMKLD